MALQVITLEDLKNFKEEILAEVQAIIQTHSPTLYKKWLKSDEVRKLLKLSAGTLQTLRRNGTLKYSKIGGIIYYEQEHVHELFVKASGK